ncbi:2-amino-4-hydroxy-6-hydroxymethyldihydropteridine diphosphokinase [Romboutsia sp.]|uniref:2-amino-4-hydroxy-6- hydroxymethyldihydropteridine diphosphokinase n=1 Tax=Romboutsia sp. TaxID=1965302 RepID=UPI002D02394D|nr:2-amino-4-hydroxy-6-hydroxymethyldihydropteridine diphosphokinase [Romboutsia sp.]HSQ89070.1 2-amino-4-hydroxy-6-hydroxymethyldihydropteridine diphosphokinase [Romboutsia sp.]
MNRVYLGLGTNMGDRLEYLHGACEILSKNDSISITKKSKIYETKAWGYTDQADFLNMCLEIETTVGTYELLEICQEVEKKLNRERIIRWGPRTIDIDILFFNDIILNDENLSIPHPRISERAFVLIPLMNLNSNLKIKETTIENYLNSLTCEEREQVKEYVSDEKKHI